MSLSIHIYHMFFQFWLKNFTKIVKNTIDFY